MLLNCTEREHALEKAAVSFSHSVPVGKIETFLKNLFKFGTVTILTLVILTLRMVRKTVNVPM